MPCTTRQCVELVARHRGESLVVTTMTASKVWPACLDDSPLDLHFLPSAMGHAGDIALGLALGRPDRRVVCLNGDGSLAMNLGGLLTAVDSGAKNLTMIVLDNGIYRIVGTSPVPARGVVDWCSLARAAGWTLAVSCESPAALDEALPALLACPGLSFARVQVDDPHDLEQRLPARHPGVALRDLRQTLAESSHCPTHKTSRRS